MGVDVTFSLAVVGGGMGGCDALSGWSPWDFQAGIPGRAYMSEDHQQRP